MREVRPLTTERRQRLDMEGEQTPGALRHLQRMTRSFIHDGQRISYINIYSRPVEDGRDAPLEFITARESGFEGIACVDDVARAAILALQVDEQRPSIVARRLARDWLGFVLYMQGEDGRFTNFICDESGSRNMTGRTSYPGGEWWTARAMWALARAYRATGDATYRDAFLRGRLAPTNAMKIKAVHALALMEMRACDDNPLLLRRVRSLCDAIVASRRGSYMRDRENTPNVAMWGYHQLEAVARAAVLLDRPDYLDACCDAVRTLIAPVVEDGFYHVYPIQQDGQCAYDIATLVVGLESLYEGTGDAAHHDLALACASWLDGRNSAHQKLYDPRTGCCSDGVTDGVASGNHGAESSIEAGNADLARRRLTKEATPITLSNLALPAVVGLLP